MLLLIRADFRHVFIGLGFQESFAVKTRKKVIFCFGCVSSLGVRL